MKTANRQIGIRFAKIPELKLVRAFEPERRYARRWLWRLRGLAQVLHYVFFRRPTPARVFAPGMRRQEEHEWRRHGWPRAHE